MFNIKYRGKYDFTPNNEKSLIRNALPSGAVQFREGNSIAAAVVRGFFIILPILAAMIVVGYLKLKGVNADGKELNKTEFVIAFIVMLVSIIPLFHIHEIIHAVLYPKKAVKEIYRAPKQSAYFVYCEEPIGKFRFIIMSIAPSIVLGVLPYIVWLFFCSVLPIGISVCMVLITTLMVLVSVGDYYNIFNAITQVPKKAKILNHGFHSYWVKK